METDLHYNELLERFYEKKFYFSYSSINKLLFSPTIFHSHYILNEREDSVDPHLVMGRVIHCLLLDEESFDDQFIITPGKLPSDNPRQVINEVFKVFSETSWDYDMNLTDFEDVILETLKSINLYQSLKTDEQRVAKIATQENEDYFNFLKQKGDKTLISKDDLDSCKEIVEILRANKKVQQLFQLNNTSSDLLEIHNELLLNADLDDSLPDYDFGLKGIVDNVIIDHETKRLFINDLKTTSKPLQDFADSVEYYKYWIQAVIYEYLVKAKFKISDYSTIVTFVVIDKYNQIYPFQVTEKTFNEWKNNFAEILEQVNYHYINREYSLPYELALGNVKL